MKHFLVIFVALTLFVYAELTKNGNIVTDSSTLLIWEDQSYSNKNWQSAIDYCQNLELDGYTDWRLPNINELRSIVKLSKQNSSIDEVFEHTKNANYWSSTITADNNSQSWYVSFYDGSSSRNSIYESYYVRCVR